MLGGGGAVGLAWEAGLMAGFADQGLDLGAADLIVGTSAGAIVGARLALHMDFEAPDASPTATKPVFTGPGAVADCNVAHAQVGKVSLAASTMDEATSLARAVFAPFVGRPWPSRFCAATVNARTGRRRIWDAESGAALDRAVAASSAVPGLWPPITIDGERYLDGCVWSVLNADLAVSFGRVVVISCFPLAGGDGRGSDVAGTTSAAARGELDILRAGAGALAVLEPRPDLLMLAGRVSAMMDVGLMPQAYRFGRAHALAEASLLGEFWCAGERTSGGVRRVTDVEGGPSRNRKPLR